MTVEFLLNHIDPEKCVGNVVNKILTTLMNMNFQINVLTPAMTIAGN